MPEVSPCMSVKECADYLRSTRSAIFGLIHDGSLEYQRVGRRFVVSRASVEELVASRWQRDTSKVEQK